MKLKSSPHLSILFLFTSLLMPALCLAESADAIVQAAFDYWRGDASIAQLTMTIHRPTWERTVSIDAWTQGESESLFVIKAPAKDRGNGTLKKGRGMWIYNPKVNKVIKLPPSMMSQSWQGSDFSNNDLAKTDSLIHDYTHTLDGSTTENGHTITTINSFIGIHASSLPAGTIFISVRTCPDTIILQTAIYIIALGIIHIH